MLIDEGVNRGNFDSSGLSNGYRIGVLMADIEAEILQLTRAIFQSYPNKPLAEAQDWQATMLARYNELKQKVIGIFKTHQPEILYKANLSLANGFNVGVKEALDQLNVKPERQTYSLEKSEKGQEIVGQLNGNLLKAEAEVLNDIGLKFVETVAVVAAGGILGGSLYQAIDRVFLPKIEKGLTSKITSNGKRMSITEYSEGLVRENSQTALLAGQGEVAKASGNYYVRISAHASSCPKCTPYQDQILIDDVFAGGTPEPGIELLSAAMANGLFHWNCRHTKTIWIPGFSKRIPPPPDYDSEKVAINYAIEQKQRALERAIREAKRYEMGALTADQRIYGTRKAAEYQAQLRELIREARKQGYAAYRQPWKEQIEFERKPANVYGVSDKIDYSAIPKEAKEIKFKTNPVTIIKENTPVASVARQDLLKSNEVIITDERIAHIIGRDVKTGHGGVYFKHKDNLVEIISKPYIIFEDKKYPEDTINIISDKLDNGKYLFVALKLDYNGSKFKNSIMTMFEIGDDSFEQYKKKLKKLYKK